MVHEIGPDYERGSSALGPSGDCTGMFPGFCPTHNDYRRALTRCEICHELCEPGSCGPAVSALGLALMVGACTEASRSAEAEPWRDFIRADHYTGLVGEVDAVDGLAPDNPGDWMAHCHILSHAEDGMMTVLRVAAP